MSYKLSVILLPVQPAVPSKPSSDTNWFEPPSNVQKPLAHQFPFAPQATLTVHPKAEPHVTIAAPHFHPPHHHPQPHPQDLVISLGFPHSSIPLPQSPQSVPAVQLHSIVPEPAYDKA